MLIHVNGNRAIALRNLRKSGVVIFLSRSFCFPFQFLKAFFHFLAPMIVSEYQRTAEPISINLAL